MELIIVRHGESINNVFPNQGPFRDKDPLLTKRGKAQAIEAGAAIAHLPPPDFVFSSCLSRAQETALLAWPNQSIVYVAPHISEIIMYKPSLSNEPLTRQRQRESLQAALGLEVLSRLSYELVPAQKQCLPPDWNMFVEWLWKQDVIQHSITKGTGRFRIALVSHGNFLEELFQDHGFYKGHPHNAEVFSAALDIKSNNFGVPVGFGSLTITGVLFEGFDSAPIKLVWALLLLGFPVITGSATYALRSYGCFSSG